jgi:hypothetical protein
MCKEKGAFIASIFFSTHFPNTRCESCFVNIDRG